MANNLCLIIFVLVKFVTATVVNLELNAPKPAYDGKYYEDLLDPVICQEQMNYMQFNPDLALKFLDSGIRLPRGILQGNFLDMGDYHQCLGITADTGASVIEGKYCQISEAYLELENVVKSLGMQFDPNRDLEYDVLIKAQRLMEIKSQTSQITGVLDHSRNDIESLNLVLPFTLSVCVPKTCTVDEGLRGLINNNSDERVHFQYSVGICRVANDKPWAPGVYVAVILFSVIGFLNVLCTAYDVWHQIFIRKDPKTTIKLYTSFSLYTNTIRLTTFSKNPRNLECMDGLRTISMMWVIVGHTFAAYPTVWNNLDILMWMQSVRSLWIIVAPFAVDTFFLFSGMLVVYTTVAKLTSDKLLRNLHLFYLNRLLRMFPLLAAVVLLQATIMHHLADGAAWQSVINSTNNCRKNWWVTLLYMQNYINQTDMCLGQTWYLAVDMQVYFICPIVLYFVLSGKPRHAWLALTVSLLVSIAISTIISFVKQFPGWIFTEGRPGSAHYSLYYYRNTLTRAQPFFLGMIFGYVLHVWSERKVKISRGVAILIWILSLSTMLVLCYTIYAMLQPDYDLWTLDDFFNSFLRCFWCLPICWVIFACHFGYGGPINWFLSHSIWKLPSRVSYAMYLIHIPLQVVRRGARVNLSYFSEGAVLYEYVSQLVIVYIISIILTLAIDSPCSTLIKLALGDGSKKSNKTVLRQ